MIVGMIEVTIHIPDSHNGMKKICVDISQLTEEIADVTINTIKEVKSKM